MNVVPNVYALSREEAENPNVPALKMEMRTLGLRLENLGVLTLFFFSLYLWKFLVLLQVYSRAK